MTINLKTVVLMLLSGDEVVIVDDLSHHYEVKLKRVADAVDYSGETTLLIRAERLED